MGGHPRPRPKHLAEKLLQIRLRLGLSQPKIAKRLGIKDYNMVSKFERNKNEPPLTVLLAYSRVFQISLEKLIDDDLDLFD